MENGYTYILNHFGIYITAIWYILRSFGNFVVIWYIFQCFGILFQEKSGKIWQPS
jgi:hypothetical protein